MLCTSTFRISIHLVVRGSQLVSLTSVTSIAFFFAQDFAEQARLMTEIHASKGAGGMAGGGADCADSAASSPKPAAKKRATEKQEKRKKSLKSL